MASRNDRAERCQGGLAESSGQGTEAEARIAALTQELRAMQQHLTTASAELETFKEALRESEKRHRLILQTTMDGFWMVDMQGRIMEVNETYCRMSGYSADELLTMRIPDLEAKETASETAAHILQVMAQGEARFETRHRRKDGSIYEVEASVQYRPIDGGRCVAFLRDITERRQAEAAWLNQARYLSIIEDQTELICRYLPDGRLTFVNRAYSRYYGIEPDKLAELDCIPHIPKPELLMILGRIAALTPAEPQVTYEHPIVTPPGEVRWQRWTHRGIYNDVGKLVAHQAVGHDITDSKQAEAQIQRSLKEKEVLLKEIHHRVKNNMQVVCSLLSLQARGIADPTTRALFEESRNRVFSMALIHDGLYRSRDLAFIDFKRYLLRLVADIAQSYDYPSDAIAVEMDSIALDVNVGIPCGLIVNELVSNCLKYAFADGRVGSITVGINRDPAGNNVLTVEDNGVGLPAEIDCRNPATLGLQLVNGLIDQLHGSMALDRQAGTKFIITFPGIPQ